MLTPARSFLPSSLLLAAAWLLAAAPARATVEIDAEENALIESLRIERARVTATLLHPPGHDYYRILRSKLHWGRGTREGQPPGA